jgi:hypothetical protein
VSNNVGVATSRVTALKVLLPPGITTQPQSQTVTLGSTVTLSIVANGQPPLAYQWQLNGVNLADATNSTLTITNFQLINAGGYNVTVVNSLGAIDSDVARLTVVGLPNLPLANNFNARATVSNLAFTGSSSNIGANLETSEPRHAGNWRGLGLDELVGAGHGHRHFLDYRQRFRHAAGRLYGRQFCQLHRSGQRR